jgi:hypothetical protein
MSYMSFIRPKTFYRVKIALIRTMIGLLVLYDVITECEVVTRAYQIVLLLAIS